MEFRKMTFCKIYHANRMRFEPKSTAEIREDLADQLELAGIAQTAKLPKPAKAESAKIGMKLKD